MRTRTIVVAVVIIVVVGVGATAAIAFASSDAHGYRTAEATTGTVTRERHGSGTIQPISQATVAFPISGTVASVDVKIGDQVTTGATLAGLETASLESAVLSKQAALESAELDLYKALHGEAVTGGGGGNRSGAGGATTPNTNAVTAAVVTTDLSGAAQAVATAQHEVDTALAGVNNALIAASTACGQKSTDTQPGKGGGGSGAGATTVSPSASSTTTTTTPGNTNPPATGIGSAACQRAQQSLFNAQEDLAQKQHALGQAENAYGQALQGSPGGNGNLDGGGGGGGNGATGSTSVTYSAEQLVAYQAAVDAAAIDVFAAQESVAQATIKSPISGTVVALSLHAGQQVTAGSSTANVVIAGGNGYEIATSVGVNDITQVKVGDAATVVPDGSLDRINGKVVFVGSPTTSGTSTTYPVVIGLTGAPTSLRNGAMASTTIDTATSKVSAVLVPTSAVHNLNGRHSVTVLSNEKTSTVNVEVGVVGAQQTEITAGLKAEQTVVLADLNEAVPSSSADSRIASRFGSGLTGGNNNGPNFGGP